MAALVVAGFAIFNQDPYLSLFVLVAILATIAILLVQTLCSAAVIGFFHVKGRHPETANAIRTLLCPILGGIGMVAVIYLLISNMSAAAGAASETLFFDFIPWIVVAVGVGGVGYGLWLRRNAPDRYTRIGRVTYEESATRPGLDVDGDGEPDVLAAVSGYKA